jgi:soluble lytic murein transglycosylase
MPATALDMDPSVLRLELEERDRNVTIGTAYLAFLSKRFKGNLALSTAGYNAGPQAVERWLKEYGSSLGLIEFIESIPYRETRDYVGSIIRNYFWYSKKLRPDLSILSTGGLTPVLMPSPTPSPGPSSGPPSVPHELEYFWKPIQQNGSA